MKAMSLDEFYEKIPPVAIEAEVRSLHSTEEVAAYWKAMMPKRRE